LGLAKWASVPCVAGAWQTDVVRGWRSIVDGGETCRWRQREETCRCDEGGFAIWGRRHDLGFVICCRWLIFVCIYASVMFTFSRMKNMEVPWWWHDSQIALTMKEKIAVAADLWF